MARVLVTGGAGFIGSHLVERLLSRGDSVHLVLRRGSNSARLAGLKDRLFLHPVDTGDRGALARVFEEARPECVFHLAAQTRPHLAGGPFDAVELTLQDVAFLVKMAAAAAEARTPPKVFVRAGTLAEYGDGATPYRESQRERPNTAYGAAALAGTHYLNVLKPKLPFAVASARLGLVYGPGQSSDFLIPLMIGRLLRGEPVTIENPEARRDLLFVDDAVDGLLRLSDCDASEVSIVNICSGKAPTMGEVAKLVLRAMNSPSSLLRKGGSGAPARGPTELIGSAEFAALSFGWRAQVSLEEGIRRTAADARHRAGLG